jgi:hypothetical protein
MSTSFELVEQLSILSDVHPGEFVHICIRRDLGFHPGCKLNGPYLVDLHVGPLYRLAKNYAGLSRGAAHEVVLRYLLEHVDGIASLLH